MKTIKETMLLRLAAQAEEADTQGLTKVAESLTDLVTDQSSAVRPADESCTYERAEFEKDLNDILWEGVLTTLKFYDIHNFDAPALQELVDLVAEDLTEEVCAHAGIDHGVGAFESKTPGEGSESVILDVSDE